MYFSPIQLTNPIAHANYTYHPGQFNMLYLYGVGEVAISIVSDPEHEDLLVHTINRVGRVTKGFAQLKECAVGHFGHCQIGGTFVCKNGSVYAYPEIKTLLVERGF